MPYRKISCFNNCYYHVFNRSLNEKSIFDFHGDPSRALSTLDYYRFKSVPMSFSKLKNLIPKHRKKIYLNLKKKGDLLVEIVAFCLMPNHFHFLLRQLQKNGVKTYVGNFQNSYAKFFNLRNQKTGPLFKGRFRSVWVKNDSQILHLSRYIHLNPYSSGIVKKRKDLISYPWSSFSQYVGQEDGFCCPEVVLG